MFGKCLSTKITPEIVDFDASGLLGGIIYKGRKPGSDPDAGLSIPGIDVLNPFESFKLGIIGRFELF